MRAPCLPVRCLRQEGEDLASRVGADPVNTCYELALAQLQCLFPTTIISPVDRMLFSPGLPVPKEEARIKYISPGSDADNDIVIGILLNGDRSEPLTSSCCKLSVAPAVASVVVGGK